MSIKECRFNKTGVSGLIEHREIPAELQNYSVAQELSIDCMWNITVQPGYKVCSPIKYHYLFAIYVFLIKNQNN